MFFNSVDERSTNTIDGDLEAKRSLLTKLHHAAYCLNEGYTQSTLCPSDPLCCASKRLFEHMSCCTDVNCGVPCCKSCRRVWRHYRKCRHVNACPLCSVLPSAYTSVGLAPRFTRLVVSSSMMSERSNAAFAHSTDSSMNSSFGSTCAVVLPAYKTNGSRQANGKENTSVATESSINSTTVQVPSDHLQKQLPSTPTPPTPPTPQQFKTPTTTKKFHTPKPYPPPRRGDPPKDNPSASSTKPPLSPRRPQWALF